MTTLVFDDDPGRPRLIMSEAIKSLTITTDSLLLIIDSFYEGNTLIKYLCANILRKEYRKLPHFPMSFIYIMAVYTYIHIKNMKQVLS